MNRLKLSRFFSVFIAFSLLVGPLPLSAIAEKIASISLSEYEVEIILKNLDTSYLYLGEELSNIARVVSQISALDEAVNSPLHNLEEYIAEGFSLAESKMIIDTLKYAKIILEKNYKKLDPKNAKNLATELNTIADLVKAGSLTVSSKNLVLQDTAKNDNDQTITRAPNNLTVKKNLKVLGKSFFEKHMHTKQGIHAQGKLKVGKSAKFKSNVTIKGNLSVADLAIASCVDNLCVNNLSATDATINNLTLGGTLSITDLTLKSLSVTDLAVASCIDNLCVNNLSTKDATINNLTLGGTLSITDLAIKNLSVTDLAVASCIDNLCVNTLSVNDEVIKTFLRLEESSGGEYIGLQAPSVVPTSYTLTLPSTIPTANQILRANAVTPTNLEWATNGGDVLPAASKTIYVTKYGNDITGDGSFDNPYLTLSKAISVANGLASAINPINILIAAGIYVENNSVDPLTVTAAGVAIVGSSVSGVIIVPSTPANNLLLITNTASISTMTLQSPTALATGITVTAPGLSTLNNVRILNFLIGASYAGSSSSLCGLNNCVFTNNGTAISISNTFVECNSCVLLGVNSLITPAAHTGISMTGSSGRFIFNGGLCALCTTGFNITGNSIATINSASFRFNTNDIVQSGASQMLIESSSFEFTNGVSDIDVQISGAGTTADIIGCNFHGASNLGIPQGTGLFITDNAVVNINSSNIHHYITAIQVGDLSDSSSTQIFAASVSIRSCTTDLLQKGSTTLEFNSGVATNSKISINDPTNVELAFFDLDTNDALTIGSTTDVDTRLVQAAISNTNNPEINYKSSIYSTQAIGLDNSLLSSSSTWFVLANNDAHITSITTDRSKISGIRLVSDAGSPIGGTTALRGWDINKNSSAAELSFNYQNSDIVGQIDIPEFTVMQLDGFNNQLQLPTVGTQIVFAGDTNLYRSSANVLKTDDNVIVGPLTSDRVVVTDPITDQLSSSIVTGTELSYLSGVTSPIQTQLNSKVNKSGDTMTGTLSATDIIANNISVTGFSATDAVIQDLDAVSFSVIDETVTGTLSVNDEVIKTFLRLQDLAGTEYIGLQAAAIMPSSYTVTLPAFSPTAHQVLRANQITPTNLEWATEGGSVLPTTSKNIYVTTYGNDITGDGSFNNPYASLLKAISVANGLASASNPITILISTGIYIEDNSMGPLSITSDGISVEGDSAGGVILIPNTPMNDFISITKAALLDNLTLNSFAPLGSGIVLASGNLSSFNNLRIVNFLIGVSCTGTPNDSYIFNNCLFSTNGTALSVNNVLVECNTPTITGGLIGGGAANTGISITGSGANVLFNSGTITLCLTGVDLSSNAVLTASSVNFRFNASDIVQTSGSRMTLSGCTFELTNGASDIDMQVSGAGTTAEIISCEFNGNSPFGVPEGTGIQVTDSAVVEINGGVINNYTTGLQIGISSDTASTQLSASNLSIKNCTTDILQQGLTALQFNACIATSTKININDATNVLLAFFDLDTNDSLTIGSTVDMDTTLIQAAITTTNNPEINYKSSIYSTQAVGFDNSLLSTPTTWFTLANNDAHLTSITTDRTKISGIRLVSDEGSPVGGTTALRGWDISKNGSAAELSFNYQNSDIVGQIAIPEFTVMQLDGFNNQLQLPTIGTQIVFAGDTNLYRSSANVLKTDDNVIVGPLTPDRVVVTDAITDQLASSIVTGTELSYLSGVTSPIQTQLNGKVNKSGDIMTGTLQLPAGTTALPSLVFTGSTTTGLSAPIANSLSFSTNAIERMKIDSTGIISIDAFTTPGIVHNDASGNLSSSLIINNDITNATIANAKLATISSTDTPGAIVVRDGSGNFTTNMITIDGTVTNATDAATKAYVDSVISTGLVAKTPALVVSTTNIGSPPTGLLTIDGVTLVANDRVLLVGQSNPIENGLWLAQAGAWNRPADFANGSTVGQAYVLILSGSTEAGSSWLATTPLAVVGTDPISFVLFTLPNTTTGANVGTGTGLVFKNKTGVTLNFRTLLADTHMVITTNPNDITIGTDATDSNTTSTIVARDASGNFAAGTITATLNGAALANVLKVGDTMTGALQLPAGTTLAPSLNFTGSTTTGLSAPTANSLSFSTNALERMKIDATGVVSIDTFTIPGVVHNDASGNLSSSLIVNADVDPVAGIVDTKLATISTTGKVLNSATTATNLNTANAIVARDASGNFSAGTIIASLNGAASANVLKAGDTMTGTLQLPAGTTALPALVFTGSTTTGLSANSGNLSFSSNGLERMAISSAGTISVDAFTLAGIVHNDSSGNLSSSFIVDADVSPTAAIVDTKLATISTAGKVANSATTATDINAPMTIVVRDASGNFSAGTITANLIGNATAATTSTNFSGLLAGDVTGTQGVTVVNFVGGQSAANVAAATALANAATSANTPNTIVKRDATGNFSAGAISVTDEVISNSLTITPFTTAGVVHNNTSGLLSSSLIVNADVDPAAAIVDTKLSTISTPGKVANSATTATSLNTANAIVARDASGNFSAGTIIASLNGAASANVLKAGDTMTGALQLPAGTTALPSLVFTGSTTTGLSANAGNLSFSTNGSERMKISSGGIISIDGFTVPGIVHNDISGNLSSSLIVNADVSPSAAITDTKLATISTAGKVANSATTATSSDVANTIVLRNGSGNFATNMITIDGTTTNPTDVATKAYVDSQIVVATGTNLNTPNTIVKRDGTGSFAAQVVSVVDEVISGNLILSTEPSTSTTGNIIKGSNRFIHDFGTNNTFVGINAGNFSSSGTGGNSGFGGSSLLAITTGNNNTAIGFVALSGCTSGSNNISIGSSSGGTLSTGSNNIYLNANASTASESNTIRIGTSQTTCFIQGINGVTVAASANVRIDANGQMGTVNSSQRFKYDIEDMNDDSSNVLNLRPVSFKYKADKTNSKQYGLIAEEVEELIPELVVKDREGLPLTVQYDILSVLLLNEIKKQQSVIKAQNITIESMNEAIHSLKKQIQQFMERVTILEANA